ncbi:hypothetical protein TRAPUB_10068 [Trametes pubescens]|uniref:Uncharacterized protein n=1 Tax=Trametes pubescens TaxID=154538 RepID=A0A1M2W0K1_TRAPU|nr:hypothetical protein TRAPUB_10068 [Trametes pubescens]
MATTLPSFVELMATLGLGDPNDSSEPSQSASRHSRSSSHSSSVSHFTEPLEEGKYACPQCGKNIREANSTNLPLSDADLMAYTPISSYVRRKTPQNSPTSPTFARDRETVTATAHPLTIPALPTLLSPASITTQSSDSEEDEMDAIPDNSYRLGQSPHVLTSPPWQSRYFDPAMSPRIAVCAPLAPDDAARLQVAPIA